ncbi:hypothetical protein C8R46DRAFT_1027618 [Mycena filopes]|nr:hypothetical protein C8R46DRAFT_1027618 [Mycena filopes]
MEPMEGMFEHEEFARNPTVDPVEAEQMHRMNHQGDEAGAYHVPRGTSAIHANMHTSGGPPGGDPDDSDSDDGPGRPPNRGPPGAPPRPPRNDVPAPVPAGTDIYGAIASREPHFEFKLKAENVPKWDGN